MQKNVLTSLNLTDKQKQTLIKVFTAPTPVVAGKEARNGQSSVEASKILIDLGLMTYQNDQAQVTDAGVQVLKDENLIDDSETVTSYGDQMKNTRSDGSNVTPPPPAQNPPPSKKEDNIPDELLSAESFDLLRDLNKRSSFIKD